ncbi:RNA-binding ATPase activator esf2 [Mortierella polycephala]|uniref:18S rRNA factor 2 n=1 Tax=Mortierella polycephala TaxID=41804 RepID=A0A9P6PS49_9FUNG|nr:RNA-binding ATPase activator esf2 [Mortierella polycephala]
MSTKVKTEDIFNLPEEEDNSDASGYDSEDQESTPKSRKTGKASSSKGSKKKNTAVFGLDQDNDSDSEDSDESDDEQAHDEKIDRLRSAGASDDTTLDDRFQLDKDAGDQGDDTKGLRVRGAKKQKKVKPLTPEALEKFQAAREKTGIVYLSRIPPFMKPIKLRHLLGKFGELGRVYLAPEDAKVAARRKKYGGNKKQNFTEGWVEFKDKSVAKQIAKTLNATIIGGNKNSYYHDDMWNIKYLPKFKWDHLTERIAYENASRAQRLQAEISQAKRENKFIITNIEKAKMIKNMEEKKAAKRKAIMGDAAQPESRNTNIRRAFKQRRLGDSSDIGNSTATISGPKPVEGKIKSVLGNVFGR